MKNYQLKQIQILPITIDAAWDFFSTPLNLSKITPKEMNFEIVEKPTEEHIFSGMRIQYRVRPLLGIPMKWITHITRVEPGKAFIDLQEKGPFAFWEHLHEFRVVPGGVEMEDTVNYRLPMGPIGKFAHWLFVKRKLNKIFTYRREVISNFFGGEK
jgi:ligand-binding SRPBCC domain-containing protein